MLVDRHSRARGNPEKVAVAEQFYDNHMMDSRVRGNDRRERTRPDRGIWLLDVRLRENDKSGGRSARPTSGFSASS